MFHPLVYVKKQIVIEKKNWKPGQPCEFKQQEMLLGQ